MFFNSLSGRFLLLTIVFVMLAEVLIFVPSVARFRADYLQERLELAQLASLALLATPDDMITQELADELLENAEVLNIVLRRNEMRELILSKPLNAPISDTYDLRDAGALTLVRDAIIVFFPSEEKIIRVIGRPIKGAGLEIETTQYLMPLRDAMIEYGRNIFFLSLLISVISSAMLFFAVRSLLVRPIRRLVGNMTRYRDNPEDATRVIKPDSKVIELRAAQDTLQDLQTQLTAHLKQKERLAQLGEAVAKINHDLRNVLTTTQLLTDRIEMVEDPVVARIAPKLMKSLDRAIKLCENTLSFGKAEEPAPEITRFPLVGLVSEVIEGEGLRLNGDGIKIGMEIADGVDVSADREQMFRVIGNLVGNARQAILASGRDGEITVKAKSTDTGTEILVSDTGPGIPERAQEKLFQPFQGSVRKGGTGLGLAIAAEIVRGHGGTLKLAETSIFGTSFRIFLPVQTKPE